jgi:hypothetical protein
MAGFCAEFLVLRGVARVEYALSFIGRLFLNTGACDGH